MVFSMINLLTSLYPRPPTHQHAMSLTQRFPDPELIKPHQSHSHPVKAFRLWVHCGPYAEQLVNPDPKMLKHCALQFWDLRYSVCFDWQFCERLNRSCQLCDWQNDNSIFQIPAILDKDNFSLESAIFDRRLKADHERGCWNPSQWIAEEENKVIWIFINLVFAHDRKAWKWVKSYNP